MELLTSTKMTFLDLTPKFSSLLVKFPESRRDGTLKIIFIFMRFQEEMGQRMVLALSFLHIHPVRKIMDPHFNKDHNLLLVHEVCNISTYFQKKTCLDLDRKTLICNKS